MPDLVAVSGGLREPSSTRRLADRLLAASARAVEAAGTPTTACVVDLRVLARPIADAMVTGMVAPTLEEAFDAVRSADGLVAVTPTYNATLGGLFKSFFDVLPEESLAGMPVLLGATGGTARHSLVLDHALRPMFSYLRAVTVPTGVYAATEDFGGGDAGALSTRIDRAAADLARLVTALGSRDDRNASAGDVDEMERLLHGLGQ